MSEVLGLFGGTFDPVHYGHLRLAEEAVARLGLHEIRWIPAGDPPHRPPPKVTARDRLAMVSRSTADNPHFSVDPSEVLASTPSYTVQTLERLRQAQGLDQPFVWLLGADAFCQFHTWFRWQDILALTHLVIFHRPGYPVDPEALAPPLAAELRHRQGSDPARLAASPGGAILTMPMTQLAISATEIRQLLGQGRSARYLLPDAVLDYIHAHSLYRTP